jgi:hypothetical protein
MMQMSRKITKNHKQYKVTVPIALLRKLNWSENTKIRFQEVKTPSGTGLVILPEEQIEVEL